MKQLNMQIRAEQHEWIRRQAFERRISMADIVREAISKLMEGESKVKRIWQDAVGKSLREVLEGTYEKPAEEIYVDNEELGWYQGNLDERVLRVFYGDDSIALVTDNLAWIDRPTQIHVYNSQAWLAEESHAWMSTAEKVAKLLGDDGQRFETENGDSLDYICAQVPGTRKAYDEERELTRYEFPDGSAIVAGVGAWDIEGDEPFSWAGAE